MHKCSEAKFKALCWHKKGILVASVRTRNKIRHKYLSWSLSLCYFPLFSVEEQGGDKTQKKTQQVDRTMSSSGMGSSLGRRKDDGKQLDNVNSKFFVATEVKMCLFPVIRFFNWKQEYAKGRVH